VSFTCCDFGTASVTPRLGLRSDFAAFFGGKKNQHRRVTAAVFPTRPTKRNRARGLLTAPRATSHGRGGTPRLQPELSPRARGCGYAVRGRGVPLGFLASPFPILKGKRRSHEKTNQQVTRCTLPAGAVIWSRPSAAARRGCTPGRSG
jgi:hypothetical protein